MSAFYLVVRKGFFAMTVLNVKKVQQQALLQTSRQLTHRQLILLVVDVLSVILAVCVTNLLSKGELDVKILFNLSVGLYVAVVLGLFHLFNLYKSIWRYASVSELFRIVCASILAGLLLLFVDAIGPMDVSYAYVIIYIMTLTACVGGTRFTYRLLRLKKSQLLHVKHQKRVLVVGGGEAGRLTVNELFANPELKKYPVGIIDDDATKLGRQISGVTILGTRHQIVEICQKREIDEIILAIPRLQKRELQDLIAICKETKCRVQTLPGVYELIDGKVNVQQIRDVEIEDLLGREPIQVDLSSITSCLQDKVVLVTGGGGSIGSELCRQIATFKPKTLILIDIYENNAYDIQNELRRTHPELHLETIIASIRDKKRLDELFTLYQPDMVYHAAAHKHVPLMEDSPQEAIKNNVFGTYNVVQCAHAHQVKRFVLISTDKAVNPTNIMGATKRLAEMIVQAMNAHSDTDYVAVRFGNVLGSNGSVIPLFKKQIAKGGPITVTHPDIIRYFMTIPEAVQLVLQAGAMADGGEIFVLDMGDPVKIVDLARDLITLSGFTPDEDIKIEFTGLRPGEKMYEELLMAEEGLTKTENKKIFIGKPTFESLETLHLNLKTLEQTIETPQHLRQVMKGIVKTYQEVK